MKKKKKNQVNDTPLARVQTVLFRFFFMYKFIITPATEIQKKKLK